MKSDLATMNDADLGRAVATLPGAADAGLPLSKLADLATLADRLLRHGWTYDRTTGQWNPPTAPDGAKGGPPDTRRTRRAGVRVQPGEQRRGGRERPGRPEGGP